MKRSAYALLMALFLATIGIAIFIHKLTALNIPLLPAQSYDTWSVEARIVLDDISLISDLAENPSSVPNQLSLYLPQNSERYKVIDESFEGIKISQDMIAESDENRTATLTLQTEAFEGSNPTRDQVGRVLFYRATVQSDLPPSERIDQEPSTLGQQIVDKQVEQAARSNETIKSILKENPPTRSINSLIEEAKKSSKDGLPLAKAIYKLSIQSDDNRVRTLQEALKLNGSSIELAAFLLNEAGETARAGNGILLNPEKAAAAQFSQWLEVNQDRQWFAYDPVSDRFGAQTRYLTWWYGLDGVLSTEGTENIAFEVTARPDTTDGLSRSVWHDDEDSFFLKHSFIGLPLSTQRVIQVLVMIPIGALIVAALHQMVGFSTFGTFTPVLIALSFRETGLVTGIVLFMLVVVIGIAVRSVLNQVQLLVVPRLSAVLTVTVLVIGALALVMDSLGLRYGLSISLFPIVILAMTIERAAVMWEEDGGKDTAIATAGSLAVAVIGFLCISNPYVQHLAFVFPELLLVVLALTILLGRYNGYKLIEYFRFMALQKQLQQANS